MTQRVVLLYGLMILVLIMVGFYQSWNVAFGIFNLCVISAVMALGVNMQWGYAGLFNVGVMGFTALGGLTAVLVSMPPVTEAWARGQVLTIHGWLYRVHDAHLEDLGIAVSGPR